MFFFSALSPASLPSKRVLDAATRFYHLDLSQPRSAPGRIEKSPEISVFISYLQRYACRKSNPDLIFALYRARRVLLSHSLSSDLVRPVESLISTPVVV